MGDYIDIHTHKSSRWQSFGIHPFDARTATDVMFKEIAASAGFAIGEIGLDYRKPYYGTKSVQRDVFVRQIEIANQVGKPLIIHQVKALDDVLELLKEAQTAVVFHGFSGSSESAVRILKRGYYLSFGHLLLTNEKLQGVLRSMPPDRIFLETDQSETTIEAIYEKAARVLAIPLEQLITQIEKNYDSLARKNRATIG